MNDRGIEPLSAEMKSLLAKERNFTEERAELEARVMARARATLRGVPAASTRSFWQRRMPLLVAAALVLAFTAAAIAARQGLRGATDQRLGVPPPAGAAHPAPARVVEPRSPVSQINPPASGPAAQRPEQGAVAPAPRGSAAADASDADALELGLLQRARASVAASEFSAALQLLAEHQRRFPAGRLREEREALRIKALAGLGRDDEARRAAERFRERFPRSVLSSRIEETVRPKP
jgi:hypothetical protein